MPGPESVDYVELLRPEFGPRSLLCRHCGEESLPLREDSLWRYGREIVEFVEQHEGCYPGCGPVRGWAVED